MDRPELLDYVPGSFRVIRHVRSKLSCRSCETITQAPSRSLPIRRDLSRSTMADMVGQSARLLRPLVDTLGRHVMAGERVHADGSQSGCHTGSLAIVLKIIHAQA